MGMSTHVVGIRPPDERWQKMKAAYDACRAAGITIPNKVEEFFDYEPPDPNGVVVDLSPVATSAVREWSDDTRSGLEVDLAALPPGIRKIRFYNSW